MGKQSQLQLSQMLPRVRVWVRARQGGARTMSRRRQQWLPLSRLLLRLCWTRQQRQMQARRRGWQAQQGQVQARKRERQAQQHTQPPLCQEQGSRP